MDLRKIAVFAAALIAGSMFTADSEARSGTPIAGQPYPAGNFGCFAYNNGTVALSSSSCGTRNWDMPTSLDSYSSKNAYVNVHASLFSDVTCRSIAVSPTGSFTYGSWQSTSGFDGDMELSLGSVTVPTNGQLNITCTLTYPATIYQYRYSS